MSQIPVQALLLKDNNNCQLALQLHHHLPSIYTSTNWETVTNPSKEEDPCPENVYPIVEQDRALKSNSSVAPIVQPLNDKHPL